MRTRCTKQPPKQDRHTQTYNIPTLKIKIYTCYKLRYSTYVTKTQPHADAQSSGYPNNNSYNP